MSGLDQVFIKAFEKETRRDIASSQTPAPTTDGENAPAPGAWRRIERAAAASNASVVPAPHMAFAGGNLTPRRVASESRSQATQTNPPIESPDCADAWERTEAVPDERGPAIQRSAPSAASISLNLSKYPVINVPARDRGQIERHDPIKTAALPQFVEPPPASEPRPVSPVACQVVVSESLADFESGIQSAPGAELIDWTDSLQISRDGASATLPPDAPAHDVEIASAFEIHCGAADRSVWSAQFDEAATHPQPAAARRANRAGDELARVLQAEVAPLDSQETIAGNETEAEFGAPISERRFAVVDQSPAAHAQFDLGGDPAEFVAAWEVDRFQWPTICDQLLESDQHYFRVAGQRLREAARDGLHVLGITAANRGEGQTALVLCLARSAAAAGMRVAVIDADVDNPQLALRLGLGVAHGWEEFAQRNIELSECAVQSVEDRFTVVPIANSRLARGQEGALSALLRTATRHFDLVIVDMGALCSSGGRFLANSKSLPIDAAIVVRDLRSTHEPQMRVAVQQLKDAGVEAVGVAENFGPSTVAGKAA